jgi:catechol 2,3-dioxygenase-like lactoylglutathione lyase family enzyme
MSFFIDHVVITVFDINKSVHFYSNILGMELQEFLSSTDNTKENLLNLVDKNKST